MSAPPLLREKESRPHGEGEAASRRTDGDSIVAARRRAVERIAAWSEREEAAYSRGFEFGRRTALADAYHAGYEAALRDVEEHQAEIRKDMAGQATSRSYRELEYLRWGGPRLAPRTPQPGDYMGGPVTWEAP